MLIGLGLTLRQLGELRKQLKETEKARLLDAVNQIYNDLHRESSKEARRYVYAKDPAWLGELARSKDSKYKLKV